MKKYIHPFLIKVYVRDLSGKVSYFFKGVSSKKESFTSNFLVDLKSIFGKKNR